MGVAFKSDVKKQVRALRELREQIDEAIRALLSRPMVVTPRPEPAQGPPRVELRPEARRYKVARRVDRKAREHTLNYVIARGDRGVTPQMVASALRCSVDAARERLRTLVQYELVIPPTDNRQIFKAAP